MKSIPFFWCFFLALTVNVSFAQENQVSRPWFEQFKFTVALVEVAAIKGPADAPDSVILTPWGTAFWVKDSATESAVLVSNKHIFNGFSQIVLSQYSTEGYTSAQIIITLKDKNGNRLWVEHPDSMTDIAAIKVKYFERIGELRAEIIGIPINLFAKSEELSEGDDVFILGFPMGIRTTAKSFPMIRTGVISLKPTEDFLVVQNDRIIGRNIYLVDANILGGNSGSPVFLKPTLSRPFISPNAIGSTQPKLIGIVSSYVTDWLPLVKAQSTIYAQGNSGITIVHRSEDILKVVIDALK